MICDFGLNIFEGYKSNAHVTNFTFVMVKKKSTINYFNLYLHHI